MIWHLHFWHRWRPYAEADYQAHLPESLIQKRAEDPLSDDPEERLLASSDEADHELIWRRLLDSDHPAA